MAFTINNVECVFEPEKEAYRQAFSELTCELDTLQEEFGRVLKKAEKRGEKANAKLFDVSRNVDTAMREKLDSLLGQGVCAAIYGNNPLFAMSQKVPLWFGLVDGLYGAMAVQLRPKGCGEVIKKYRTQRISRNRR